jgi:hypothetical protein
MTVHINIAALFYLSFQRRAILDAKAYIEKHPDEVYELHIR